ncbi:MAG: hypothetical protein MUC36_02850 [Planctomycetes bacterium]|jgi:hypothetical protein|nr:hypothetical protein [Planctomycetota bacterium]
MNSTLPIAPTTSGAGVTAPPAHAELAQLRARARTGIWVETLGLLALLLVAFALPSFLTDRSLRLEWIYRAVLLATFVFVLLRVVHRRLVQPLAVELGDDEMALAVERSAPETRQALISSLQFDRELRAGAVGATVESMALKQAVVADVRARLAAIPFGRAIDAGRVRRFGLGLAAAAVFFGGWTVIDRGSLGLWARRNLLLSNAEWPRYTTLRIADGGPAEVRLPQGDALSLRIAIDGPVPDQLFVDYDFRGGDRGTEPLSRTGEREFSWTIESVLADMTLQVEGGDALPLELRVVVVERPRIDDLSVRVTFPDYMQREPMLVPATEGELRLPKGAQLAIAGRSQKPLAQAFLLFGNDQKTPLAVAADGAAFAGEFAPTASGLLTIDVVDRDQLGAGSPPKLSLRVGDDKPPTLEFRLRGIGASITAHARIPGDLKAKDDFGLREVSAVSRALDDQPADKTAPPPPEVPFGPAGVVFGEPLPTSALRYETTALVDLTQWNKIADENATGNPIRPGMLFSLRFQAKDNFGPGAPHEGLGETMSFRVVTREKLVEELRRRQVEQRQELKRLIDDEQRARLELAEMVNPTAAGDRRKAAEARLKSLARQQQSLGRRVAFVGESYQRILWEYENNRLIESNKVRQLENLIPAPLQQLAKEAFPATARQVDAFVTAPDEATRAAAVEGYRDIERRMTAILQHMEQAESLAALIEDLKLVINLEGEAIRDVEKRRKDVEGDIFKPKKPK